MANQPKNMYQIRQILEHLSRGTSIKSVSTPKMQTFESREIPLILNYHEKITIHRSSSRSGPSKA